MSDNMALALCINLIFSAVMISKALNRIAAALEKARIHWRQAMSEHKGFTPRPWVEGTMPSFLNVYAENAPDDGGDIICMAPEDTEDSMRRWKANAALIADAPKLYAEVLELRKQLTWAAARESVLALASGWEQLSVMNANPGEGPVYARHAKELRALVVELDMLAAQPER